MNTAELQSCIADFYEEHGIELTLRVLSNMLSIAAEHAGSFDVKNDRNGVTISVEVPSK